MQPLFFPATHWNKETEIAWGRIPVVSVYSAVLYSSVVWGSFTSAPTSMEQGCRVDNSTCFIEKFCGRNSWFLARRFNFFSMSLFDERSRVPRGI
jgi:hypothetical protein